VPQRAAHRIRTEKLVEIRFPRSRPYRITASGLLD